MQLQFMFTILTLAFGTTIQADGDFQADKSHQDSCTGCLDSSVYTHNQHHIDSLLRLQSQPHAHARCYPWEKLLVTKTKLFEAPFS